MFYLDAIDDIFFERNVSGNSSDVTLTKEESFTEQQKKTNKKIQPVSVKLKKKYVQNKQNNNMQTKGIQTVVL